MIRRLLLVLLLAGLAPTVHAQQPLTVFAAASLKEAMESLNARWSAGGKTPVRFVFAASGVLARQIDQGAPADLFISADDIWMDWVAERRLIVPESRHILAGNRLVVIAAARSARRVVPEPGLSAMALHVGGKIVTGDPRTVPAGTYAKAALERLGLWDSLAPHLVMAENVRVALALVARGEATTGIVYASDALAEPKVAVIGAFPAHLHPPIRYPVARIAASRHEEAVAFLAFLASPEARQELGRFGFLAGASP